MANFSLNIYKCLHVIFQRKITQAMLCTLLVLASNAQNSLPIRYIGIENGLSNNSVTSLLQDSYGFLWVGTYDGLNRYDGYSFKVYRHRLNDSTTLVNNRVSAIVEDQENRLWIGTKKGLSIYSNITHRFSTVYYQPVAGKKGEKIAFDVAANELSVDNKGNVFIAPSSKPMMVYQKASGLVLQVPIINANSKPDYEYQVQTLSVASNGNVWVFITGKGIGLYDYNNNSISILNTTMGFCSNMKMGADGTLWLASGSDVYKYSPSLNKFTHYGMVSPGGERVSSILTDNIDGVWIGTDGGGIYTLENNEKPIFRPLWGQTSLSKPSSTAISVLYKDRQGTKWIGTLRGGLNCISNSQRPFKSLDHDPLDKNSLVGNFVSVFEEDNEGRLWIGTDGNGISIWNRKLNKFTNLNQQNSQLANNLVTFIKRTSDGKMWVATYGGGVNLYDNKTGSFTNYLCINEEARLNESNVWTLYEDKNRTLWAGTITGSLYRFNSANNRFEIFDTKLSDILSLTEDSEGNFWGGNFESLIKIDRTNKRHEFYNAENPVRFIHEDKKGNLWAASEGSGLLLFDKKTKKFRAFTEEEGLSNNSVLNILEDNNGNLWLSTFNGLSRLHIATHQVKKFFQSDGLQSNQFNYNAAFAAPSGEFFFGGLKGMDFFYPDSVALSYSPSNVLITGLRIDNKSVVTDNSFTNGKVLYTLDALTLPYEKAVLSIDFSSPEFNTPDQISYAYFLEGWDKGWNHIGSVRTAHYSRLNEGNYRLHIMATNAGGIWGTDEKIISITILPPWYRTWWAIVLYLSVLAGLIAVFIKYKNKQSRLAYEVKLAHLQAGRDAELNNKKLDFFTNIAHEFRTPITLIVNPVKDFLYKPGAEIGPAELQMVYRNSRRLLSLIDQLLLFKKAESGVDDLRVAKLNLTHVCREVFLCFTQQAKSQQIDYRFESPTNDIEVYADREKLEIAIFNLLSNAMKFTPPNGTVRFQLDETTNRVGINVQDSGCGIPEEVGEKLFERFYQSKHEKSSLKSGFGIGLYLAKSFVEAHNGELRYHTKVNEGTTFSISLQKGSVHFTASQIAQAASPKSMMLTELNVDNDEQVIIDAESTEQPQRDSSMDTIITSGHTILLVDDNEGIRQYLTQVFKGNFTLYEASNGKEGLAMAKQYLPDIIISDIVMNEMTGIEFCKAVKDDPALSYIQVILLTGSSSAEIKLKSVECGADDYITKPFERELLLARVASLLKSRNNLQKYFYNEITLRKNELTISEEYKVFLDRCIQTVEAHIERDDFSIKMFAKEMGMSHSNLYKRVKQVSGQSINGFIRFIRLRKAAELLINTDCNVTEAAFQVGIADGKYFRAQFVKLFGMVPSEYKKKYHHAFQKNYKMHEKAVRSRADVED
jgi:signal transduction histidine kinase/ligand-binding sensor domain-containing protein/DNA-binding response OmpR family regulator